SLEVGKRAGIGNEGACPTIATRTTVAAADASATGIKERALNSKSNNSTASNIAEMGEPNVAVIPAAAPAASNVFLSIVVIFKTCPNHDPNAPPVATIGPSAPKGPPLPIAIAAEIGFKNIILQGILLSLVKICSIASGIPWPRIALDPYRAINPTINPPMTGIGITHHPQFGAFAGSIKSNESR